ncbi:MAG: cyclic nucleotide-binding/CBS domain-containing protein [Salinigranum sp.]
MTVARTDVVTVDNEASLADVARVMTERAVGSVVVVDDEGAPVGMVTDRDLVTYGLAADRDPEKTIANEILAPNPVTADVEDEILEVTQLMADERLRRVPIVDGETLAGIVTLDDVVSLLAAELGNLASVVEAESPSG